MNIDEIKRELTYQAALTYYDEFDIKKVQELFLAFMNHGVYSDDLINLKSDLSTKDYIFIFHSELKLLSIYFPEDKQIALYLILKYHIGNIANKNIDPIKELYEMMHYHNAFYLSIPFDSRYEELSKNPYDINDFHDLYMWHDDAIICDELRLDNLEKNKIIMEIKKDIIDQAKTWLKNHPDNNLLFRDMERNDIRV
jgi:hypothetical protein